MPPVLELSGGHPEGDWLGHPLDLESAQQHVGCTGTELADGARRRLLEQGRGQFAERYVAPLVAEATRLGIDTDELVALIRETRPVEGVSRYDARDLDGRGDPPLPWRLALDQVSVDIEAGSITGLLGRNGAGKTTAVRILATLLRPDSGQASVCGYDVLRDAHQVRQLIGLTGQYASVDEGLSGTARAGRTGRPRAGRRAAHGPRGTPRGLPPDALRRTARA